MQTLYRRQALFAPKARELFGRKLARPLSVTALILTMLGCKTVLTPYGEAETVLVVGNIDNVVARIDDVRAFGGGLRATEALAAGESLVFVWDEFTSTSDASFVVFIDENGSESCDRDEPAWGVLVDLADGVDSDLFRGDIGEEVQCGNETGDDDGRDDGGRDGI